MVSNAIIFDQIFAEHTGHTQQNIRTISELYDLPNITQEYNVSEGFMHIAAKKQHFITLILYDGNGRILLCHDENGFCLPGASIRKNETIHDTIARLVKQVSEDIEISDVLPVCNVSNIFSCEGQVNVQHSGITFLARIRNTAQCQHQFVDSILVSTKQLDINGVNKFANREILEYVINKFYLLLHNEQYETQDEEIEINQTYSNRYALHNAIIKPLLKKVDAAKVRMKKHIMSYLSQHHKVLDVSCGDDSLLIDTTLCDNNIDIAIGNDISRSQIQLLNQQYGHGEHGVFFTNHNATALPYKHEYFDVTLCKNTLHHMPSRKAMISLFQSILHCSKEILLVEIENPLITGGTPEFIHKFWYRRFLKDVGGAYLSQAEFESLVKGFFGEQGCDIAFDHIRTLQGNYLFAYIKKSPPFTQMTYASGRILSPSLDHHDLEKPALQNL
ncbi:MAG: methyltransferase domain-containing protein [Candidatus Absconditabacterales bacterium]